MEKMKNFYLHCNYYLWIYLPMRTESHLVKQTAKNHSKLSSDYLVEATSQFYWSFWNLYPTKPPNLEVWPILLFLFDLRWPLSSEIGHQFTTVPSLLLFYSVTWKVRLIGNLSFWIFYQHMPQLTRLCLSRCVKTFKPFIVNLFKFWEGSLELRVSDISLVERVR